MKKILLNITNFGLILTILGIMSCVDYLDIERESTINPDDAFSNFYSFQGFTEELYHCIPDFANYQYNNFFNFGEEEHYSINGIGTRWILNQFDLGNFWNWQAGMGSDNFFDRDNASTYGDNDGDIRWKKALWPLAWYGIRKANLGIENLDRLTDATEQEKDLIEGQLYFFRAWFHFHLITYWGGMPYIDKVLPSDEQLLEPRLSYRECADLIAADFRRAADLLPIHWDDITEGQAAETRGRNDLRINKIMALGYLGKNYLYAGSPLMNKVSGGNDSYDIEYCKKAANAFGELLELVESGQTPYSLVDFSEYTDLWMTNGQNGRMPGLTEAIFRGPHWGGTDWSMNKQYLAANILQGRSWSQYPTANYANYFGMENGLPINEVPGKLYDAGIADAESGYDPEYPWKNRDPRFYITYAIDTERMILGDPGPENEQYIFADLASGGLYRNPETGSNTGYLLKKFNPIGFNRFDNAYNQHTIHISWMRLADVYLMYAEAVAISYDDINAKAETLVSNSLSAVQAVNKIRNRAGVSDIHEKYLNSVDEFMKELRRERAVELAWEGHRFNDLRRWLLLIEYPYNIKTSVEFNRSNPESFDQNDPTNNRVLNLREEVFFERRYTEKHYWLPLKKSDVAMYPEFYQNPGW